MVWSAIGRIILVPLGLMLAAFAAFFVLVTLGLERLTHAVDSDLARPDGIGALFDLVLKGQLLASGLSVVPALAVIIIGEVARIRSLVYYLIGGGLALAAVPLLARAGQLGTAELPPAAVWQVFATAGFAGGFVYWLIAGRRA